MGPSPLVFTGHMKEAALWPTSHYCAANIVLATYISRIIPKDMQDPQSYAVFPPLGKKQTTTNLQTN